MFTDKNTNPEVRSGEPAEFDRLYHAFAPRVLAYLLRLTGGSRTEAEDLTQETFIAAYTARGQFAGSNLLAWLLGIARRRQRDAFRAGSVRPQTTPLDTVAESGSGEAMDDATTRRIMLQKALDALPDAEREAIVLVVVQGLTYAEAARVTGEPVGTVKWRVHSGTKQLRKRLSGVFAEEYQSPTDRKGAQDHVETHRKQRTAI